MSPITLRQKFAYSGGDFAFNLLFGSVGAFLLYFYTDVYGLSAAQAGLVLLVARVWDACFDVGLGMVVDRTKSRWGQMRPYLFLGAPLLGLTAVACFSVPEGGSEFKLMYAFLTYTALMSAYSLVNIPYGALPTLMSDDQGARTGLASWRMFFAFTGTLVMGAGTQPLVAVFGQGDAKHGYQMVMAIYGVIVTLLVWICAWTCKETVPAVRHAEKSSPFADIGMLINSRAWLILAATSLITFSLLLLPIANAVYFMSYVVGSPQSIPIYMMALGLSMMMSALLSGFLTKRFCKRNVWRASSLVSCLGFLTLYFIDHKNFGLVLFVTFLTNVGGGVSMPINFSNASDVADDIEAKRGRRLPGLVFSTLAFTGKAGMGLSGAIAGAVLSTTGYVPNSAQSADTLFGIVACMSLIPAAGCAALLLLQLVYPIGKKDLTNLAEKLRLQRAAT
ncbi:MAG: hypothetical protein CFE43_16955 [Burkholderiales bacterium PBB3]|nr:MAG: hypothetical protein CFE43_16955 [Burkholderiales bacterium PBB3]